MAQEIKTNTAISLCVGPFYDKTDGVTPEIALTVANSLITLIAETDDNSAPTLILDNVAGNDGTNTLAHITNDNAGYYSLLITAANVNRLGRMKLTIEDAANHCPVFHEIEVVSAQYYNAKYGTGNFSADVIAISTDTTAADNCELMFDGTGYTGGTAKLNINVAAQDNIDFGALQKASLNAATPASIQNWGKRIGV